MSTAMNFSSKSFKPRPPDKGAFPLDHFGMFPSSQCVLFGAGAGSSAGKARRASLGALEWKGACVRCRGWRQLMANEPLEKLGFKDLINEKSEAKPEK
ncbi:COX19 protein, partial [Psophia crepitans]|nr:COX19 protein [Psophia crepitans]